MSPPSDRPVYQLMEPWDHNASSRGRRSNPCAIHGLGSCPNSVASTVTSSSRGHEGEEGKEDEKDLREISVVP
jgi:hypothetical protein